MISVVLSGRRLVPALLMTMAMLVPTAHAQGTETTQDALEGCIGQPIVFDPFATCIGQLPPQCEPLVNPEETAAITNTCSFVWDQYITSNSEPERQDDSEQYWGIMECVDTLQNEMYLYHCIPPKPRFCNPGWIEYDPDGPSVYPVLNPGCEEVYWQYIVYLIQV